MNAAGTANSKQGAESNQQVILIVEDARTFLGLSGLPRVKYIELGSAITNRTIRASLAS